MAAAQVTAVWLRPKLNVDHQRNLVDDRFKLRSTQIGDLLELIWYLWFEFMHTMPKKKRTRLPTIKKIEAWILKDPWLQVNRIRGSHYLQVFPRVYPQVTLMDPHPCPAFELWIQVHRRILLTCLHFHKRVPYLGPHCKSPGTHMP